MAQTEDIVLSVWPGVGPDRRRAGAVRHRVPGSVSNETLEGRIRPWLEQQSQ